ncbi:MAG: hypothetical protein WBA93_32935 [Microcoleaceae cyanobacterium]
MLSGNGSRGVWGGWEVWGSWGRGFNVQKTYPHSTVRRATTLV